MENELKLKHVKHVIAHMMHASTSTAFETWVEHVAESKRHRHILKRHHARRLEETRINFFRTWKQFVAESKRHRVIIGRFLGTMKNRDAARVLNRLVPLCCLRSDRNLRRMHSPFSNTKSWISFTSQRKRHRWLVKKTLFACVNRQTFAAMARWQEFVRESIAHEKEAARQAELERLRAEHAKEMERIRAEAEELRKEAAREKEELENEHLNTVKTMEEMRKRTLSLKDRYDVEEQRRDMERRERVKQIMKNFFARASKNTVGSFFRRWDRATRFVLKQQLEQRNRDLEEILKNESISRADIEASLAAAAGKTAALEREKEEIQKKAAERILRRWKSVDTLRLFCRWRDNVWKVARDRGRLRRMHTLIMLFWLLT